MATIVHTCSGSWRARIRKTGATTHSKNFQRKADAEAWARRLEGEIERGTWRDNNEAERCSFRVALDRYEGEVTPNKRSAVNERSTLGIVRDDAEFIDYALARVGSSEIARLRDQWKRDGVKPATIKRRMAVISHLFTIASREWGMTGLSNPVHMVSFEPAADARTRRVTDAEIDAICAASESTELESFVRLAVATAARRGELMSMRWKYIDLVNHVARVVPKSKVAGRTRDVPLSRAALSIMRAMPRRLDGRVFGGTAGAFTRAFVRALHRARQRYLDDCERANVKPDDNFLVGARLHDLRHEATSRFAPHVQAQELARITGHATLQMVMRYYNPSASQLAQRIADVK